MPLIGKRRERNQQQIRRFWWKYARNSSGPESFKERQLLAVVTLFENILLEMRVGGEVNGGKRYVTKETGTRSSVEAKHTELPYNMNCTSGCSAF